MTYTLAQAKTFIDVLSLSQALSGAGCVGVHYRDKAIMQGLMCGVLDRECLRIVAEHDALIFGCLRDRLKTPSVMRLYEMADNGEILISDLIDAVLGSRERTEKSAENSHRLFKGLPRLFCTKRDCKRWTY